ncbi:MAG TPA: NAD-dependent epimerase/dehydratase family protein [Tepidisphaeraceae bacterium]|jgi:nucleoside-diphosphate-sugar epimerase|nr:NAD-dependent epimerase/dehydratase family protein [Tepidisphaeraceae bacterium]
MASDPPRKTPLPDSIRDVEHLEELLSEPSPGVIETVRKIDGDFIVLGVGGKMGPTLARMLRRAIDAAGIQRRVVGVSRFTAGELPDQLRGHGIEPLACDLLDPPSLSKLPDVRNVVYMAGMKFGTTGQHARTWAMNAYLPGMVAQKFRHSRIVAFSTGNVYPMVPVYAGGCAEDHDPFPNGEYGMSALGRERIFEHFSRSLQIPMAIIRLNYAVEMRYGVLVDMAERIRRGEPIDVSMGNLNAIWQADANAMSIRAFEDVATPPLVLNLTGPETLSVRGLSVEFGRLMNKPPTFVGSETGVAFLNNAGRCFGLYGYPSVAPGQVVRWTADWVSRGGQSHGKPTHFEVRDGKY